jgi:hypothetical protein
MEQIKITSFISPCPTQAEGFFDGKYPFYYHDRWEEWKFFVGKQGTDQKHITDEENILFISRGWCSFSQ